jgi:CrcB protein
VTVPAVVLVLAGGAVGALLRYLTDLVVRSRHAGAFPWGTFVVNVAGSLVLGVTAGAVEAADGPAWVLTVVGTGFCGALTTYSTFAFETVRLLEKGLPWAALLNVGASFAVGLAVFFGGWELGAALW